ncbi:PucR family transcriptional regulator [Leekyejoonella antrihumi]|nr:PucR family transcriptional regulator [Leekyejoonella antrihumi]
MAVLLDWLVDQHDLGLRVVAGSVADVEISWAHAIELVDPSPWLSGGELILTTGLRMPCSGHEQVAYIDRLTRAGAAALAFGVGIRFNEVPTRLAASCADLGLPLLEVPLATPFVAVTQAVARRIADERAKSLKSTIRTQRELTSAALRSGLEALVSRLARTLGAPVVILDESLEVTTASARSAELAAVARERLVTAGSGQRLVTVEGPSGPIELHGLVGRSMRRGWLAAEVGQHADPTSRIVLHHAISVATLYVDVPAEFEQLRSRMADTVLGLLLDPLTATPSVVAELRSFGFLADAPVTICALELASGEAARPRGGPRLRDSIEVSLREAGVPAALTLVDGRAVICVPATAHKAAVERIARASSDARGSAHWIVGVGQAMPAESASHGLASARRAARTARLEGQPVGWSDRLTLDGVLMDQQVRARIAELAGPIVAPILPDAAAAEQDLLATLSAFLDHNGSLEGAARAVGIHRHTLRHRLTKVEELTGLSLDIADNRIVLALALRTQGP